jgi:hypothetical protein
LRAILIAWSLPGATKTESSAIAKMLYGQETSSWGGRYVYWRKGFLDDIPYVKLIRGAFIVRKEDSMKVVRFLEENDVMLSVREVVLTARDEIMLDTDRTNEDQQRLLGANQ